MTGACCELQEAVSSWLSSGGMALRSPTASHMGGEWERQSRTVKVLQVVMGSQTLDEERLYTLFCAVEEIVNGRPIPLII